METTKTIITCDMCGKEIKRTWTQLAFGTRYFFEPQFFGSKIRIDLCDNCVVTLKKIRRQEEGVEDETGGDK